MVHPWGIDDGQGWKTPEPAGVVRLLHAGRRTTSPPATRSEVIDPFLKRLRGKVGVRDVQPARPGGPDPQEALSLVRQRRRPPRNARAGDEGTADEAGGVQLQGRAAAGEADAVEHGQAR